MRDLQPCPFCNEHKHIYIKSEGKNIFVECETCGARGGNIRHKNFLKVFESVIYKWNKRGA